MSAHRLSKLVLLSVAAAVLTLFLKTAAYLLTGSVGLLSDAAESVVNLVAALIAFVSLRYAARPPDRHHTYGHEKIEFFSSGVEGGLIVMAAVAIAWTAVDRLRHPQPPEALDLGLLLSFLAALINGGVALVLLRAAIAHRSIVLEADARHLLTDVWTSAGVLAALGLVWLTGWNVLDPIVALLVAVNILWTAWGLLRRSFNGLMDHALPEEEQHAVRSAIQGRLGSEMTFHALRTRQAGTRRFVEFHLLVPGEFSVRKAHDLTEEVEQAVRAVLPGVEVTVHIEPIEAAASWSDSELLKIEGAAEHPHERQELAP
jgi:cation diffusion facilitator family transporter